jgi:DNA polymerase elongation subunit (family B)
MKIPLLVDVGDVSLSIVRNSVVETVPLPMKPHLYIRSRDKIEDDGLTYRGREKILRIPIGYDTPEEFDVVTADSVSEYKKLYFQNVPMCKHNYDELVYSELPDFYYNYPNTDPLKIAVLDMEVLTSGMGIFPNADRDPIIAIGFKLVGIGEPIIVLVKDPKNPLSETDAINEFVDKIVDLDPDIIATYNGVKFDIRYLLGRMDVLGIDPSRLGRISGEVTPENIPGRIHWDMWNDVENDQTLLGLPNRRLKTVGYHFKVSDIIDLGREALSNTSQLLGKPELSTYLSSDVMITEALVGVYIDNHIAMAEMVGIPLREKMRAYDSMIPKLFHVRHLGKKYIGVFTNDQRYKDKLGTMRYESAKVGLYLNGEPVEKLKKYYPKIYKIDFSGQYPSAMDTFNLSPETTKIVDYRDYTGKFRSQRRKDSLMLCIPNKNANIDMIIKVNLAHDGFLRNELRLLREQRRGLKAASRDNPNDKTLYSQQWAIKVLMNSIYGYEGLTSSYYGDLSVAVATVGVCKWLVEQVEDMFTPHLIETDSVTGCTPLCILRDDKYIDFLPISELIPEYAYESKNIRYSHTPKSIKILTRNGWKGINYIKQHKVSKDIYRVNTTDGYVEVTEDHSLFSKDGNSITPLDMNPGDEIELRELPNHSYDVDYSEDFAWLLGFIAAEGTIDVNAIKNDKRYRYQLSIVNQNPSLLDRCVKIIREHYLIECSIYDTIKSSSVYKISKNNKRMVTDLYSLCYTERGSKKVPLFVLNGTSNIKKAYLDGIWAGDGSISKYGCESLASIDHTLFAGVRYLMNCLGKKTSVLVHKRKMAVLTVNTRNGKRYAGKNVNINKVKRVEKLPTDGPTWVYDISTEDGSFIAGIGGLCCFNTDGIMLDCDPDINNLNKFVTDLITNTFGIESHMEVELDEFQDGFFYRMKNYILREMDGKISVKGNMFKSSKHSRLYEKAMRESCEFILDNSSKDHKVFTEGKYELVEKIKNWDNYEVSDFIKHIVIQKDISSYYNRNCMQVSLALQAKKYLGQDIVAGDGIDYIVVNSGIGKEYRIAPKVNSVKDISIPYYDKEIDTVLDALGFDSAERVGQLMLF